MHSPERALWRRECSVWSMSNCSVQHAVAHIKTYLQCAACQCTAQCAAVLYIKRAATGLLIGTPRPTKTDTCRHAFLSHFCSCSLFAHCPLPIYHCLMTIAYCPPPIAHQNKSKRFSIILFFSVCLLLFCSLDFTSKDVTQSEIWVCNRHRHIFLFSWPQSSFRVVQDLYYRCHFFICEPLLPWINDQIDISCNQVRQSLLLNLIAL